MTQHGHDVGHGHGHRHGQGHEPAGTGLADLLDLDARLLGGWLDDATAWSAAHASPSPRRVVDVGAGTGAGSLALARRFPDATVLAVDRSPAMLARLEAGARDAGLARQVSGVLADLGDGWPGIADVDLVWASSSLHELADPDRTMADIGAALVPGGLLVVVELDSLPRFLPDPALEQRVHDALDRQGWNHHPDWTAHLERAGFEVADPRGLVAEATGAGAGTYADTYLRMMRPALQDALCADDLDALDRLLDRAGPDAVLHDPGLVLRSSRTAWAARRPLRETA